MKAWNALLFSKHIHKSPTVSLAHLQAWRVDRRRTTKVLDASNSKCEPGRALAVTFQILWTVEGAVDP